MYVDFFQRFFFLRAPKLVLDTAELFDAPTAHYSVRI